MEKILSIIIPSYNMEGYLPQCLDSLLVPNIDILDILIINDGSKDATSEIAHRYAQKYPYSIRVIDKQNGNYGSCINIGLTEAVGKYVKVLDADDRFYKNNLESFISFLLSVNVDLVLSDYNIVDEKGSITKAVTFNQYIVPGNCDFDKNILSIPQGVFQMHAVSYNMSILKRIKYTQTEGISYTDQEWMFLPMSSIYSVAYFNKPIYRYLVGRPGQTVMVDKAKHLVPLTSIVEKMIHTVSEPDISINWTDTQRQYIFNRLKGLIIQIIKDCLLYCENNDLHNLASRLDSLTHDNLPEVWKRIENDRIKNFIPVKYIYAWRNSGYNANNVLVKTCRILLRLYHN